MTPPTRQKHGQNQGSLPVIVGIGSSAGGLGAIRNLVAGLPKYNGCAYVVVQHLSQGHNSNLTPSIASATSLKTVDIIDKTAPKANYIYVTPPGYDVVLEDGLLRLVTPALEAFTPSPSIDRFLKSSSKACGERCIAVILSGTGSDGAYGVEAIRDAGGISIAQDTDSADYEGMSNAAVATGCIDLVLPPDQIGEHLTKILSSASSLPDKRNESTRISPFFSILQIVLAHTRVDFRDYKQATVRRRIERRMTALGITDSEEYALHCRKNPREVDALFKDLLISVTRFFRNKAEFNDLQAPIQELVETKRDTPLRIWVAGCATGEEVYSIAILLAEAMGGPAHLLASKVQIFATDIDKIAISTARAGYYPPAAMLDVPKNLADKYFIQEPERVRVIDALKSIVLFTEHNICQDPPFLKMDLICCRNVLIYFGTKLQNKVISRLHYAMETCSYLFLGTAESLASTSQLFKPVGNDARIFRKRESLKMRPEMIEPEVASPIKPDFAITSGNTASKTDKAMFDALARSLGQNTILVTQDFSLKETYGEIDRFIDPTERHNDNPTLDILTTPLREEARGLVASAIKLNTRRIGIKHQLIKSDQTITRLEAIPCLGSHLDEPAALLVINRWDAENLDFPKGKELPSEIFASDLLKELDIELAKTRDALQQTIEKLEYSNQELQSLSMEMQHANFELHTTNEELGSSNEELQSTNEELITVNEELQFNTSELESVIAEQMSVLSNIAVPIIVLNASLRIVRTSILASDIFSLTESSLGQHISQIQVPRGFPDFVEMSSNSVRNNARAVQSFTSNGKKLELRCIPFTNIANQTIGTTLIFVDTAAGIELDRFSSRN